MPGISGTTRLFAVLGDPVDQVRAPELLNPLFERLGRDAVLFPVHATRPHLAEIVRGLCRVGNLDGLLVTVPHKIEICRFADELSHAARISGCANALRREPGGGWFADNFDGAGFVRGLRGRGHEVTGKRVALVGAGGAGAAIAAALLDAGVEHLTICDLDRARLDHVHARLDRLWPGRVGCEAAPRLDGVHLAVNATPLGLRPEDPLPFEPSALAPDCAVADIIMKPRETRLLRTAAGLGHQIHHGNHMLDEQLDLYRAFFHLDEATTATP
ncbi:shikimate dehydrogenase [Saccharopolyspora erythraea]|uniref:shikimate dehydrogenase family protein n=1 Tax=Saccharopolyspora erythraea TaxID=1836 RepID=UPI001BADB78B|nr:ThiF family adenylyltransferase [Saccharopolyspora erythraea]QUH03586.1 shikimate dehydrogenase [Saccharopolyspora erythraea]